MNQVVIKAMELLYHHWDLLRDHQKHLFVLELLSPQMVLSLFLHWNVHVRQFYYYILIYWLLQCSAADRKNRIDVYDFLKEFARSFVWNRGSLVVHAKMGRTVNFTHPEKLSFSIKQADFGKNFFTVKGRDISALLKSRPDYHSFLKDLDIFTFDEFVRICGVS